MTISNKMGFVDDILAMVFKIKFIRACLYATQQASSLLSPVTALDFAGFFGNLWYIIKSTMSLFPATALLQHWASRIHALSIPVLKSIWHSFGKLGLLDTTLKQHARMLVNHYFSWGNLSALPLHGKSLRCPISQDFSEIKHLHNHVYQVFLLALPPNWNTWVRS